MLQRGRARHRMARQNGGHPGIVPGERPEHHFRCKFG
jgi:hypothetical protein